MNNINFLDKILKREVYFHFTKSWWHGGQNVNKRMTKAELYFNVAYSKYLTEDQKEKVILWAWHRIHHHEKILIMTCQEERYQRANKKKVIHHFRQFMEAVLIEKKTRIDPELSETSDGKRKHWKKYRSARKFFRRLVRKQDE